MSAEVCAYFYLISLTKRAVMILQSYLIGIDSIFWETKIEEHKQKTFLSRNTMDRTYLESAPEISCQKFVLFVVFRSG